MTENKAVRQEIDEALRAGDRLHRMLTPANVPAAETAEGMQALVFELQDALRAAQTALGGQ